MEKAIPQKGMPFWRNSFLFMKSTRKYTAGKIKKLRYKDDFSKGNLCGEIVKMFNMKCAFIGLG